MKPSHLARKHILFAAFITLIFVANVFIVYTFKSAPYPGANDFYSRWSPIRGFWRHGLDPYGDAASLDIQMGIYGRPVVAGEDPGYFAYPFYTVFLMAPLGLLEYAWAEAVWVVILGASLIAALLLLMNLFKWKPRPWLWGISLAWTLFFYPAARGLLLGQPGLLVYFLEVLAIWAWAKRRDPWVGLALALSTIKPQMGFLFVPALLLWAMWRRRWRVIAWFAGTWGGLMLLSFVVQPSWMAEWLEQIARYPSYTAIGSPLWVLTRGYLPFLGPIGEGMISALLLALLAWAWWQTARHDGQGLGWALCLTLTITHIIAVRTASPHFVVFIIPLLFYFKLLASTDPRRAPWAILLIETVLLIGLWYLFFATFGWLPSDAKIEHPALYLPLPFGFLLLLLGSRKLWLAHAPLMPTEADHA